MSYKCHQCATGMLVENTVITGVVTVNGNVTKQMLCVVFSDLLCITMTVSLLSNYVSLLLFPCIINML